MQRSSRTLDLELLEVRGQRFDWTQRAYVMGILNATPDSFSGDGLDRDVAAACARAMAFVDAGADIVDIGGESTRPGHQPVSEEEELRRVLPTIRAVREAIEVPISIDTFKPSVARAALEAGADIINCVWGALPGIVDVAVASQAPLVVVHNRAVPEYAGDVVEDVIESLERSAREAVEAGMQRKRIIVDPGIGFGKKPEHNVQILSRLNELTRRLPYPLLVGTSRKSFIGVITGLPVEQRLAGTAASVALAVASGANMVRVHDVREMVAAVRVAEAILRGTIEAPDVAHTTAKVG